MESISLLVPDDFPVNGKTGKHEPVPIEKLMDQFIDLLVEEIEERGEKVVKIAARYDNRPMEGILYNNWRQVKKDEPHDALGVIARASEGDRFYVGEVIKIKLTDPKNPKEQQEEQSDYDSGEEIELVEVEEPEEDYLEDDSYWQERLSKLVTEHVYVQMCDGHISTQQFRQECIMEFQRLNESVSVLIAQLLGWKIIYTHTEHGTQVDQKATSARGLAFKGHNYLVWFLSMIQVINETSEIGYDNTDYTKQKRILKELGIDYEKLINQINTEAGRQVIEIPK